MGNTDHSPVFPKSRFHQSKIVGKQNMIDFKTPWIGIETDASSFTNELAREMPLGHVLYGVAVQAVGRRQDCDDFLFAYQDGTERVAVVHLTWAKETDPKWPFATVYGSVDEWCRDCMVPDHEEWIELEEED